MFSAIMTKGEAQKAQVESLFRAGGTFGPDKIRYDGGKYAGNPRGMEYSPPSDMPIWYERRQDKDGAHYVLLTFRKNR